VDKTRLSVKRKRDLTRACGCVRASANSATYACAADAERGGAGGEVFWQWCVSWRWPMKEEGCVCVCVFDSTDRWGRCFSQELPNVWLLGR